jgi:hypothetical protein
MDSLCGSKSTMAVLWFDDIVDLTFLPTCRSRSDLATVLAAKRGRRTSFWHFGGVLAFGNAME